MGVLRWWLSQGACLLTTLPTFNTTFQACILCKRILFVVETENRLRVEIQILQGLNLLFFFFSKNGP